MNRARHTASYKAARGVHGAASKGIMNTELSIKYNDKNSIINALLEVLREEVSLYRSLAELLAQEQQGLIRADTDAIEETGKKKETLTLKVRLLEESRLSLVEKLNSLASLGTDPTLSAIIAIADHSAAAALRECQSELRVLYDTTSNLVRMNQRLVGSSLQFLRGSLAILGHLSDGPSVYQRNGAMGGPFDSQRRVDRKV